jgi:hypothetical protein
MVAEGYAEVPFFLYPHYSVNTRNLLVSRVEAFLQWMPNASIVKDAVEDAVRDGLAIMVRV